MDNPDLKYIKKHYGENFAKFCRASFPTLLEKEGLLQETITSLFAPSRFLYEDITKNCMEGAFRNYVLTKATSTHPEIEKQLIPDNSNETPYEIMNKVGYKLYKCETKEDVQSFKKYWHPGEELCTFRDDSRLDKCHIYFAIKDYAEKLKREDFEVPDRQDTYGTSVIGIQFSKGDYSILSIKNRYNHAVANPDATFSNDLENIASGLTYSFAKELKIDLKATYKGFEMPKYVADKDGKLYPYNLEINNVYYCPDNIIISNGVVKKLDKSKYELIDNFLIDKESKTIRDLSVQQTNFDELSPKSDYFCKLHDNFKKANITTEKGVKKIELIDENGLSSTIITNPRNEIVGYSNHNIKSVGDNFFAEGKKLINIDIPNLTTVGNGFMMNNRSLRVLRFPNLKSTGRDFMRYNNSVVKMDLPSLTDVDSGFMFLNTSVIKINLPELKNIGDNFFYINKRILSVSLPKAENIGDNFLHENFRISRIEVPKVKKIGDNFLYNNKFIQTLHTPKLEEVGSDFLINNTALKDYSFDNLRFIPSGFLKKINPTVLKEIFNVVNSNQTKNYVEEIEEITANAFNR